MYFRDDTEDEHDLYKPCGGPYTRKQVQYFLDEAMYADWMWQKKEAQRILTRLAYIYGEPPKDGVEKDYE